MDCSIKSSAEKGHVICSVVLRTSRYRSRSGLYANCSAWLACIAFSTAEILQLQIPAEFGTSDGCAISGGCYTFLREKQVCELLPVGISPTTGARQPSAIECHTALLQSAS